MIFTTTTNFELIQDQLFFFFNGKPSNSNTQNKTDSFFLERFRKHKPNTSVADPRIRIRIMLPYLDDMTTGSRENCQQNVKRHILL